MTKENKDYFYRFGYKYFGPLLEDFCYWLLEDLCKNNIQKVYFLSRDGYIIKQVFDIINKNSDIKSYYFYASRRSITVPSFCDYNNVYEIFSRLTLPDKIKLESLIKRMGLEEYNLDFFLKKYDLKKSQEYSLEAMKNDNNFNNFFLEIFPYIKENSIVEKNNIMEYSKKNDFFGKVAIVDIGWNGTMQISLENLFEKNKIFGYYMGLNPNGAYKKEKYSNRYKGFICDHKHNQRDYKKISNFISIFEFLFLAQHGSVKRFINNNIEFYDYEYENSVENEIVKQIQKGAINYIENIGSKRDYNYNSIKKNLNKIFKVFLYPSLTTAKKFGRIKFLDDELGYIANPNSITYYIYNIKELKKDYINSGWRIGFMKSLFKIVLPYFHINSLLRKFFNKE